MVETQKLGTMSTLTWIGAHDEGHDTPYLLVYSLGDTEEGAEAAEKAVAELAQSLGLSAGGDMADGSRPDFPVTLLMEGRQAVLNMQAFIAQGDVPQEWLDVIEGGSPVHLILSAKAWPEALPGKPVTTEALAAYIGDEAVVASAAHCMLPVGKLRSRV
ncbi:DUF5949 family protein [Streptomyces sp. NPDC002851]